MSVGFLSRVALRDSRIFARLAIGAPSSRLLSSLAKRSDCNTRLSLLTAVATRGLHTSMPGLKEIVFKLTDVGEGIAEVEVLKWFVNEGDKVKQFDKLCEVQSDKANVEITSRFDGRITKLHHAKGEMAKVGHPLVSLDDEADSLSAKDQVAQETFTSPSPSSLSSQSSSTIGSVARKIIPYKLTDVGEGIAEVEVLKWFVKEGDAIKQFDKLCEVQSDKANVEITSRFDGRVARLHYQTGQMAKVGQPLVDIESEEAAPQPVQSHQSNQSHQSYQQSPVKSFAAGSSNQANMSNRTLATPAVRRLAREYKLDISKIQATGKDGRVTKGDILNFVSNPSAVAAAQQTPAKAQPAAPVFSAPSHAAPIPSQPIVQTPAPVPAAKPIASEKDQVVPVRGLMRTMIKTMTESLQIPALGYSDEIVMNELIKLRTDLKPVAESKGVKITYMPFLIKAVSMAITQYPIMNSSLSRDMNEITIKNKRTHETTLTNWGVESLICGVSLFTFHRQ
eukprot:TRINITY_DN274_c0_g2_i1.p1 TRINITY_DN274_c0_g2~~TRINITY_DN274_c0_g2_i1.p1  ORF type:complete len:507 (+),score=137.80 TRINITY_DN274_c0_g2_i1:61-1581(+)